MGIINVLDAQTANMIAAGEVVDRPASALKELLENALDAEATKITVEIKGGGRAFLRVTDNGKGFYRDDMPKALLRHATSKIASGEDLNAIATFGFRGEALAAISSVSHMEIISKSREESVGTRLTCDENGVVMVDTGCPDGTSVIVRDLFYNTPARQKFLKRDSTEATACISVAEHAALSHPEVSFTVSVEGERRFYTAGDGKLLPAIYSVYGKGFASGLFQADYELEGVHVHGFVSRPDEARGNRSMQIFYVNGRCVHSKTMMAALEEAFQSYLPHGRYPSAVLFLDMQLNLTDVNVHPAKLEIRFADERRVFSAIYYAVKNELTGMKSDQEEPQTADSNEKKTQESVAEESTEKKVPEHLHTENPQKYVPDRESYHNFSHLNAPFSVPEPLKKQTEFQATIGVEDLDASEKKIPVQTPVDEPAEKSVPAEKEQVAFENKAYWKYIGEAYDAFLFFETENCVYVVDKHAAHERILYESLSHRKEVHMQELLSGVPIELTASEAATLCENAEYLEEFGFRIEPFGGGTVLIRAVPSSLAGTKQLPQILETFAEELTNGSNVSFEEKCDRALFTVACKAAVKAGIPNDRVHNEWIIQKLMENEKIRFCPHGRPVMHALSRREIEKYFDR